MGLLALVLRGVPPSSGSQIGNFGVNSNANTLLAHAENLLAQAKISTALPSGE
jgi:hypothetical protein